VTALFPATMQKLYQAGTISSDKDIKRKRGIKVSLREHQDVITPAPDCSVLRIHSLCLQNRIALRHVASVSHEIAQCSASTSALQLT